MIEKVIVENFQAHSLTEVELGRITVLVGPNGAGKSSFIRALKWLFLNIWDGVGVEFVRWDTDFAHVTADVDGHKVERLRSTSDNLYLLDEQPLRAFGRAVPEDIKTLLNITETNFQGQRDQPFWLSLNGPDAASALNDIFHLTAIDETMSNVASELRKARAEAEITTKRLAEAREAKASLNWTEHADVSLKRVEKLQRQLEDLDYEIEEKKAKLREVEEAEKILKTAAIRLSSAERTLEITKQLDKLNDQIETLQETLKLEDSLCQYEKALIEAQRRLDKMIEKGCPLCKRVP